MLNYHVIENAVTPQYCVIWLHGLTGAGAHVLPIASALEFPGRHLIRHIMPNAPSLHVTLLGGAYVPGWFDVRKLDSVHVEIDREALHATTILIHKLITQQIKLGIPAAKIFLAGFSQGGAVAYSAGLTYPKKLGGIIAMSSYLPESDWLKKHKTSAQKRLPVLITHGRQDDVVSPLLGHMAYQTIRLWGGDAVWHEFDMKHEVSPAAGKIISDWLEKHI